MNNYSCYFTISPTLFNIKDAFVGQGDDGVGTPPPLVIMTDANIKQVGGSEPTQGCRLPGDDASNDSISTSESSSNTENQRRTYDASRCAEHALEASSTDGLRLPVNPRRTQCPL